jgi:hypothetical protein
VVEVLEPAEDPLDPSDRFQAIARSILAKKSSTDVQKLQLDPLAAYLDQQAAVWRAKGGRDVPEEIGERGEKAVEKAVGSTAEKAVGSTAEIIAAIKRNSTPETSGEGASSAEVEAGGSAVSEEEDTEPYHEYAIELNALRRAQLAAAMFVEWCSDKVDSIYRTFYL